MCSLLCSHSCSRLSEYSCCLDSFLRSVRRAQFLAHGLFKRTKLLAVGSFRVMTDSPLGSAAHRGKMKTAKLLPLQGGLIRQNPLSCAIERLCIRFFVREF